MSTNHGVVRDLSGCFIAAEANYYGNIVTNCLHQTNAIHNSYKSHFPHYFLAGGPQMSTRKCMETAG